MKLLKSYLNIRNSISIIVCGIIGFWSIQAFGEEWTVAQKEVWRVIETRWEKLKAADFKFMEDGIHDDAIMWYYNYSDPINKMVATRITDRWITSGRPVTHEIKPYAIQVFGDIANVMYAYRWKAVKKASGHSRILVTLKKENGKWLIISSMNSSCNKLTHCLDW